MCQLTYIFSSDLNLLKLAFHIIPTVNSLTDHQDGYGVYHNGKLYKTASQASRICFKNAGFIFDTKKPVLIHVRKASTFYRHLIKDQYSHPFESENFILAHNGTLSRKDFKREYDLIDSQLFLKTLEEKYVKVKDFCTAIKEAMDEYKGKFAFLIFEKNTGNYYAVVGKTANLHMLKLTDGKYNYGYILNTGEKDLSDSSTIIFDLYNSQANIRLNIQEKVVPLKNESIFLLTQDGPRLIGEIKETEDKYYQDDLLYPKTSSATTPVNQGNIERKNGTDKNIINNIKYFLQRAAFTLNDLNNLCIMIFDKGLMSLDYDEQLKFQFYMMEIFDKNITKEDRRLIRGHSVLMRKYFPWFLNIKEIKEEIERIEKTMLLPSGE